MILNTNESNISPATKLITKHRKVIYNKSLSGVESKRAHASNLVEKMGK